jgi:hypothetical protein
VDLNELFRKQIEEEKASMLYFVLREGNLECLQRYKHEEKDQVIDMLKSCKYTGTKLEIPYFEKKAKRNAAKTS